MDAPQSAFLPLPTPEEVEAIRESRGYSQHPCRRRVESPPPIRRQGKPKPTTPTPQREAPKNPGVATCAAALFTGKGTARGGSAPTPSKHHTHNAERHTLTRSIPPITRRPLVLGPPTQGNARHTQETQPPLMPVQPTGTMVGMGLLNCGAGSGGSGLEAGLLAWLERAKPKAATIVQLGF